MPPKRHEIKVGPRRLNVAPISFDLFFAVGQSVTRSSCAQSCQRTGEFGRSLESAPRGTSQGPKRATPRNVKQRRLVPSTERHAC
eukprot:4724531-Pyramimonas_sp.AAC.1